MSMQSERILSLWQSSKTDYRRRPGFNGDPSADIVVIGAGITGSSIACQLAVDGRQVVVIDDGDIGGGNSGRTTVDDLDGDKNPNLDRKNA